MDKRSDIKVLYRNTLNLPIEIKRHYHRNVWTAPQEQLKKLYAQDPGAGGRGIYFVIWFGTADGRQVPRPPNGSPRPATASEMENALYRSLPERDRIMIDIMVLNCSPRTAT